MKTIKVITDKRSYYSLDEYVKNGGVKGTGVDTNPIVFIEREMVEDVFLERELRDSECEEISENNFFKHKKPIISWLYTNELV